VKSTPPRSSQLIAIFHKEPDAERYVEALQRSTEPRMSPATYVDAAVVEEVMTFALFDITSQGGDDRDHG
jgi:uncharacterized protein with PIN domain